FPVYKIVKNRLGMRKTFAILESWEDQKGLIQASNRVGSSRESSNQSLTTLSQQRELCSMAALEKVLALNPDPFLKFSATKYFTAENVLFLTEVCRWKEAFASAPRLNRKTTESSRSQLFNSAVAIYISRGNEKTKDFPINVERKIRQDLDAIFGPAVPTGRLDPDHDVKSFETESWIMTPKTI